MKAINASVVIGAVIGALLGLALLITALVFALRACGYQACLCACCACACGRPKPKPAEQYGLGGYAGAAYPPAAGAPPQLDAGQHNKAVV